MKSFPICYDISPDGSECPSSSVTGGYMTCDAEDEEEAIREASLSIEGVTGQKIVDIWVPTEDDSLPPDLRAIYPIEQYGKWGVEQ